MKKLLALFLFLFAGFANAGPADSVVRLPSHGGSGTVIATGDGWTLILSCYHCFEGGSRNKPIAIDMPHTAPSGEQKVGVSLVALGSMDADLALIKLNAGPMPYVSPVAPVGFQGRECWSIGFDEMKTPAQQRPAKIVASWGANRVKTDARPWHGRSGGGLIDRERGYLVGVCSAYTGPSNHAEYMRGENGIYVSLPAIHRFLHKAGVMKESPAPEALPYKHPPQYYGPLPGPPQFAPERH